MYELIMMGMAGVSILGSIGLVVGAIWAFVKITSKPKIK